MTSSVNLRLSIFPKIYIGAKFNTVTNVHIYKYIWTFKQQNFRNGSKSTLRKPKIYIYERFFGKIFENSQNLYIVVGSNVGTEIPKIWPIFFIRLIPPLIFKFFWSGFFLLRDFRLRSADFGHILKIIRTKIVDLGRNQWSRRKIQSLKIKKVNFQPGPLVPTQIYYFWPYFFRIMTKIRTPETQISQQEKTRSKFFEN